jgi:hypothetical protein
MDVPPQEYLEEIFVEDSIEPNLEDTTSIMDYEAPLKAPCEEPRISLHALSGFSTPQTLKMIGYIKHHNMIVLIERGNTHNFIHRRAT